MKISFTVNGQVSIILEPETKVEEALMETLNEEAKRGAFFSLTQTMNPIASNVAQPKFIITARA
jgi:hypothetical protein